MQKHIDILEYMGVNCMGDAIPLALANVLGMSLYRKYYLQKISLLFLIFVLERLNSTYFQYICVIIRSAAEATMMPSCIVRVMKICDIMVRKAPYNGR